MSISRRHNVTILDRSDVVKYGDAMSRTEAIKGLRRAAKERQRVDAARDKVTTEMRRYCKAAKKAGVSITQIAREAGLSRQGVYDLLYQRPSRRS